MREQRESWVGKERVRDGLFTDPGSRGGADCTPPSANPLCPPAAVGTALYTLQNWTVTCVLDPSAAANDTSSGSADSSGGGTPSWLWPVVGSLIGVAVLAVAAAGALLVWRRRHKAAAVMLPGGSSTDGAPAAELLEAGGSSGKLGQPHSSSGQSEGGGGGRGGAALWDTRCVRWARWAALRWACLVGPASGCELSRLAVRPGRPYLLGAQPAPHHLHAAAAAAAAAAAVQSGGHRGPR